MGAVATAFVSREVYLDTEAESIEKHEYFGGKVVAMAGASYEHILITGNLSYYIGDALRKKGGGCKTLGSDMRVRMDETDSYIYPDLTVICGAANLSFERPPALLNPLIIIEVLSASTDSKDRHMKLPRLMRKEGLQEIVFVSAQQIAVEHYVRQGRNWIVMPPLSELEDVLDLPAVDANLTLADIYKDVVFSQGI